MPRPSILLVAALVAIAACGGGSPSKADQGRSIAEGAGLPKDVAAFFALASSGVDATYRLTVQTVDTAGKPLQLTTTQRLPDARVDTFNADGIRVPSARMTTYADRRANPVGKLPDDTWVLRPQESDEHFPADSDTWHVPRVCGTFKERLAHPCQMPEAVLERIIRVSTDPDSGQTRREHRSLGGPTRGDSAVLAALAPLQPSSRGVHALSVI